MVIRFTYKEADELKNIMEEVERGSVQQAEDSIRGNSLISVDKTADAVSIYINEEYMVEIFKCYSRFAGLIISQVKGIYRTLQLLKEDTETIVEKYLSKEKQV